MTLEAAPAVTPTAGAVLRRGRFWIVIALVLVVTALVPLIVQAASHLGDEFDPGNAAPAGAMALRRVLEEQGVAVRVVTDEASALAAGGTLFVDDGGTTVPAEAWARLLQGRQRVVVASPDDVALRALLPSARLTGAPGQDTATADCDLALARRAGSMALSGTTRAISAAGATVCFRDDDGAGQLVTARRDGVRVLLLADRSAFTNEHITGRGNAAVALNALGATATLTWYTPNALEYAASQRRTLQDLTPPWVTPLAALALLAGLAAAFWKGRRFGPVVIEDLPVVVRSRETVDGRARLYARAHARLRAADSLRIGAIGRIAPMLGLARSASVDQVAAAVAAVTGRPQGPVLDVLLRAEPDSDADLVRLSDDLARLEAAVRAAVVPGADPARETE